MTPLGPSEPVKPSVPMTPLNPAKPVKPVDPSRPAGPGVGGDLPQTGDASLLYACGSSLAGTALVVLGAWSALHRKRE